MTRRIGGAHTDWCAANHRCNLAEHRSDDIVVQLPGYGRAVLTRVRDAQGHEYGEVRLRVVLDETAPNACRQLRTLLTDLRTVLSRAAIRRAA
jgi:hypothetical protein